MNEFFFALYTELNDRLYRHGKRKLLSNKVLNNGKRAIHTHTHMHCIVVSTGTLFLVPGSPQQQHVITMMIINEIILP